MWHLDFFYFQPLVSVKSPDHPASMELKVSYTINSEIFARALFSETSEMKPSWNGEIAPPLIGVGKLCTSREQGYSGK